MAEGNLKVSIVAGVVAIATALITSFTTLHQSNQRAERAASSAEQSAHSAQQVANAIPGAVAAFYRGTKNQANNLTERFAFDTKVFDSPVTPAVVTGDDWRFKVPVDGVYLIEARVTVPYGPNGDTYLTPYVACTLWNKTQDGTKPSNLGSAIAFNPCVTMSGIYRLHRNDLVYVDVGKSGAYDGPISGEFFCVLVGPIADDTKGSH